MIVKYVAAYVATLIVFLAIDAVWLGIMGKALYRPTLGDILMPSFNPAPAVFFYLLYIVGILIFATTPAFQSGRWTSALLYGALLGFFCYGTYDFTNMATLRNWSLQITLADLVWGTVLTGVSATLGVLVAEWVAKALHA